MPEARPLPSTLPLCDPGLLQRGAGLRYALLESTALAGRPGAAQPLTLGSAANVSDTDACNQLCLQHVAAGAAPNCTLWQYCGDAPGGCPSGGGAQPGLPPRVCLLQSLPGAAPGFSQAPCTLADCQAVPANRSQLGAPPALPRACLLQGGLSCPSRVTTT